MSEKYLIEKECLKNALRRCYQRGVIDGKFDTADVIVIETLDDMLRSDKPFNEATPTLRDQFAMAVLPGLTADLNPAEWVASEAYKIADAMLKERQDT